MREFYWYSISMSKNGNQEDREDNAHTAQVKYTLGWFEQNKGFWLSRPYGWHGGAGAGSEVDPSLEAVATQILDFLAEVRSPNHHLNPCEFRKLVPLRSLTDIAETSPTRLASGVEGRHYNFAITITRRIVHGVL